MNVSLKIPNPALDISNYPLPEGKSKHEYSVNGITGLRIVVSKKSTTFMFRYTFQGKKYVVVLGKASEMSLKEAIELVHKYQALLHKGINPTTEQQKQQLIPTFAQFAKDTYLPAVKPHKRSYPDDVSRIRLHLNPTIGDKLLNEITTPMLNALLVEKQQSGLSNASVNRIRALLSTMFNMAIEHEWVITNPVTKVKKFKENNQIERYLTATELSSLMLVLENPSRFSIHNLVVVALVKFLLLTGVRKREAMDMLWSDVNLDTGIWLLKHNKSGKARHIVLSIEALNTLQALPKTAPHIFANPETGVPFTDIRKPFTKIMNAADIPNMRIHDLRHNFASLAVNSGESLYVVQKLLGHASPHTTQRYAHLQHTTLRNASEKIAETVRQASLVV